MSFSGNLDSLFKAQASASIQLHPTVVNAVKELVVEYQKNFARWQKLNDRSQWIVKRFEELSAQAIRGQSPRSASPVTVQPHVDNTDISNMINSIAGKLQAFQSAHIPIQTVETGSILLDQLYNLFSIDKKVAAKLRTATPAQKLEYVYDLPVFAEILSYRESNEVVEQVVEVLIRVPIKVVERVVERPHHVVVEKVVERPPQVVMMDRVVEKPVTEVHHTPARVASPPRGLAPAPVPVNLNSSMHSTRDIPQGEKPTLGLDLDNQSKTTDGAKVLNVKPGGLAGKFGIQKDDVIVALNNKPVSVAADFASLWPAANRPGGVAAFGIRRGNSNLTVNVSL